MTVTSRLDRIALELAAKLDAVGRATAERIERDAKATVPVGAPSVHLRDAIHVERTGIGEYEVRAGDSDVFYGHIVEHGSVHSAPHPFLLPAAEAARSEIKPIARAALRNL